MRFVDLIEKKKQKQPLTKEELHFFITGYVRGDIPDYQVSALLMAIYFNGMNAQETAWLTEEMLYSGDVIDLSAISGRKCDKHSTGGVGDKTSLSLAPMVAACGAKVAKMSGRGLGHTGGTLDKVESVNGFQVMRTQEQFISQVNDIGLALIGQTATLVPADKKLYALRDVTATVNSIPLIASSIMSKKLAEAMIAIGSHFGKDVKALISNMNQPLGNAIGNALEVKEAIATLQGKGPEDFTQLCLEAGSIMLMQTGIARDEENARKQLLEVIQKGKALEKLVAMVAAQEGDVEQVLHPELLPQAKEILEVTSREEGYVKELHALELGTLAMKLGAGRMVKEDPVDPAVGIVLNKKDGDYVNKGDILAYVHINHPLPQHWLEDFYQTYVFTQVKVEKQKLIHDIIR